MSAYSTKTITRKEAEEMVRQCRLLKKNELADLSDFELDKELHEYVYSENYTDVVGLLYNYQIVPQESCICSEVAGDNEKCEVHGV